MQEVLMLDDYYEPNFSRADGECICDICKQVYKKHPQVPYASWLNRLCDGRLVKL